MNKKTMNMMKVGGAMMAVGAMTAAVVGMTKKKNAPGNKMKKFAKKSAKTVDGIMNNMQYMFK